jgi:predicted amidohydrolase
MPIFKIAAAQVPSLSGELVRNVATHAAAIEAATAQGVAVLIFPELSLTGYEPQLAAEFAIATDDQRLAPLLSLAQQHQVHVVAGAPLQNGSLRPFLGSIHFMPDGTIGVYAKMHLGGNEPEFFTAGNSPRMIYVGQHGIGLAICADTSSVSHPQTYADTGATIYAASVFLTAEWYESDSPRLANYAAKHHMLTLMANHADSTGSLQSVGNSAIWSPAGTLLAKANRCHDSLLIASQREDGSWQAETLEI